MNLELLGKYLAKSILKFNYINFLIFIKFFYRIIRSELSRGKIFLQT